MAFPLHPFKPYLLNSLRAYDREQFSADLIAGITVGVVALPLAMAFAIASGTVPEAGIFTAIIAGFLISALGGSRVQIGGPAGAFIVIVYGIIQQYGLANLLLSTIMAGVLLFIMGLTRIGSLIRFIPVAIIIGFTNGIAVLIALSQVKDFLGMKIKNMPADFFGGIAAILENIDTVRAPALAMSAAALALIVAWPHLSAAIGKRSDGTPRGRAAAMTRLPGSIIVLVLATAATALLGLPLETIGSKFGGVPQGLPTFALPDFDWERARHLVGPTITIALLGAIESLLCARVADGMIEDRHDPNQELMAQGIANFIAPFFGGIPATGTIARTTTNVRAGARSPVAGIVHALTLLLIVLIAAPLAKSVPLAALAAILLFVAWNMGEWREFARLKHFNPTYRVTMLSTFFLTVVFDLTVAVEVGLVLACLFFIYRISSLTKIEAVTAASLPKEAEIAPGVRAYRLFGSLFFGAIGKIEALLDFDHDEEGIKAMVLDLHHVINIDTTGLDTLEVLRRALERRGAQLILCDLNAQPLSIITRTGYLLDLRMENLLPDLRAGLARAAALAVAPATVVQAAPAAEPAP
ncbi:MAG TPA: sulfate permease [Burkholderiales bacterium]|nr:sulfate permease [Burkholderiales bacterium]